MHWKSDVAPLFVEKKIRGGWAFVLVSSSPSVLFHLGVVGCRRCFAVRQLFRESILIHSPPWFFIRGPLGLPSILSITLRTVLRRNGFF
jgi:hypothetical protein